MIQTMKSSGETVFFGAYEASIQAWLDKAAKQSLIKRIWDKDATVWKKDLGEQLEIKDRLGWLDAAREMRSALPELTAFAEEVRREGFDAIVLLGMGGSSLAPELFWRVFSNKEGFPELFVLDSTDPGRVLDVEERIKGRRPLFVVSSKSGGTVELVSLFKYFFERTSERSPENAGSRFVAITDPGSPLEKMAKEKNFRRTFLAQEDVGGRFSALTHFGLVPAALIGVDVKKLLDRALVMMERCSGEIAAEENAALTLGIAMAVLAEEGRDKVTITASSGFEAFGDWVEQLVAESSGKEELGLVPVVNEPAGAPEAYGRDRFFVFLSASDPRIPQQAEQLKNAGHPVVTLCLKDAYDLGGEFFRWEMATAVACALLKINAFDQPDVQAAKDRTKAILKAVEMGTPPDPQAQDTPLSKFFSGLGEGDYLAILAFLPDRPALKEKLARLQAALRDKTQKAVTLGIGPRYLHSTGQLHKGGPNTGVFLLISAPAAELPVPGEKYDFAGLELAQAVGDLEALKERGRRVLHRRLKESSVAELEALISEIAD